MFNDIVTSLWDSPWYDGVEMHLINGGTDMNHRRGPTVDPGLWTYEDYASFDDGARYQVLSGHLVREPAPATWHQAIVQVLFLRLAPHIAAIGGRLYLAPVDVVLDAGDLEREVLQPDLLWVRAARIPVVVEAHRISGPPDLTVEVLSPSNRRRDMDEKLRRYQRFRVPWIWVIDPQRHRVVEYVYEHGMYTLITYSDSARFRPNAFPKWQLDCAELWAETRRF